MYAIDAKGLDYCRLNSRIREAVAGGATRLSLSNVNGHRYIACGLRGPLKIELNGTGGNDLGAYMNGPEITVKGNVQDCAGNTMNAGSIIVEGRAGDILGYGMCGGEILIRGDVGSRTGVHIKAGEGQGPVLIIGGTAGDFLGEYMAGGTIIVLGLDSDAAAVGRQCGVGMYGGSIFVNARSFPGYAGKGVVVSSPDDEDLALIAGHIARFAGLFGLDAAAVLKDGFVKLTPRARRPYGSMYVGA